MRKRVGNPRREQVRAKESGRRFHRNELEQKDGVWQLRGLEEMCVCARVCTRVCECVKRLCSIDAGSRAQVTTENINCCHGLGGPHSEGHLEPRGPGVGMVSHTVNVCECHRPGTGRREVGFLQSALWLVATVSATCLPVTGLSAPAVRPRIGPWLPAL